MLATRTYRAHPISVHLTTEEVSDLIDEFADVVPYCPEELPLLAALRDKLEAIQAAKRGARA